MAWLILSRVAEYPAIRMETEPVVVSELRVPAVDFLPFLAPLVWSCSLLELEYKTGLPQKTPNRSSEQSGSILSAEFNSLSALMLYIPSSPLRCSPLRSNKTILLGPRQGKSSPSSYSKYSSRGSSYCKASGMTTPQYAKGQRFGSHSDLDGALR